MPRAYHRQALAGQGRVGTLRVPTLFHKRVSTCASVAHAQPSGWASPPWPCSARPTVSPRHGHGLVPGSVPSLAPLMPCVTLNCCSSPSVCTVSPCSTWPWLKRRTASARLLPGCHTCRPTAYWRWGCSNPPPLCGHTTPQSALCFSGRCEHWRHGNPPRLRLLVRELRVRRSVVRSGMFIWHCWRHRAVSSPRAAVHAPHAAACQDQGIAFVGPPASAILAMGEGSNQTRPSRQA